MATSYPFHIENPSNVATKTSLLTARLNNDPDIPVGSLPVTSAVYSAPTLTITFPQALNTYGNYVLQWTFNSIFAAQAAGQTYNYQGRSEEHTSELQSQS